MDLIDRMKDWLRAGDGQASPDSVTAHGAHETERFGASADPWPEVLARMDCPDLRHRMLMGSGPGGWVFTEDSRHLLILGPARCDKTSGVLIPIVLSSPGPVVSTSVKDDVLRATAIVRSRLGRVWHYGPDGTPAPPGTSELRWSPITASKDWAAAVAMAKVMVSASNVADGVTDSGYFRKMAERLLAPVLHAAALEGESIRWVVRALGGDRTTLEKAREVLDQRAEENSSPADELASIIDIADARTREPVFTTAGTALEAYRLPGAISSTEDPNFDPTEFVSGSAGGWRGWNPDRWATLDKDVARWVPHVVPPDRLPTGRYDTVYITASADRQELVAPLVVGLLAEIRQAVFDLHRADLKASYFDRPPVVWALDEMAGMAPIKDLPRTLTAAGGQNLLVAACLQDLSLAKARWGVEAEGFLTLFNETLAFRGIRNIETLEALSKLAGKKWVTKESRSWGGGDGPDGPKPSWNTTHSEELVDVLTPAEISQGNPNDPDAVLAFRPTGIDQVRSMPYYRSAPWPQLLVLSMRHLLGQPWVDARHELAPPVLDMDTRYLRAVGGDAIVEDFRSWSRAFAEKGERARAQRALRAQYPAMVDYDDSHGPTVPSWFQRVIVVSGVHELRELDEVLAGLGARAGTSEDAVSWDESRSDRTFSPGWVLESGRSRTPVALIVGEEAAAWLDLLRGRLTDDELARAGDGAGAVLRVGFVDRPGSHMAVMLYEALEKRWPALGATPRQPGWIEPDEQGPPSSTS